MRTQNLSWRRLTVVTWAILAVALVATVAVTQLRAHGGDPDAVHACVNNSSGEVRIVGPDDECKKNWTAVDWSIQGPEGLPGAPGEDGAAGVACWDLNGNGVGDLGDPNDPEATGEDTNGDGVVDARDCRGQQGPPGPAGPPGPPGDSAVACDIALQLANLLGAFQVPPECDGPPPPPPPPPPTFALDHFSCYRAGGEFINASVVLEDQFGQTFARVGQAQGFCNPVEKTHGDVVTPIQDLSAHLTLYWLELDPNFPVDTPAQVVAGNQFGPEQVLNVGGPVALAVPTQKETVTLVDPNGGPSNPVDTGLGFPERLDHFLCYGAAGGLADGWDVVLDDQFIDPTGLFVYEPVLLCNPVAKAVLDDPNNPDGGSFTPIQNPEDHLVCYFADPVDFAAIVNFNNQFGPQGIEVYEFQLLCLPSTKAVLDQPPPPPPPGPSDPSVLVINEVDYDQPSSDTAEFVEIYNPSDAPVPLEGVVLELVNGNGGLVYDTYDLAAAGDTLGAGQYLVVGSGEVLVTLSPDVLALDLVGSIQNGSPDGVRLMDLFTGDFIDGLAYEGPLPGTGEGDPPAAEDSNTLDGVSLCRVPNGFDSDVNGNDFVLCLSTPGTENTPPP